jgi:eukaryotic-like serine/threonine-protein kinase
LLGWLQTEKNRGYDLGVDDRPKEAVAVLTSALSALRTANFATADRPSARGLESLLLNIAGDNAYQMDDLATSLQFYRQQQTVVEESLRDFGATPEWLSSKGEVMFDLAGTLSDMPGRNREALALADEGIRAVRQVLGFGPDANAEKKLVMLYGQKSLDLDALGRHREAVEASSQSVLIRAARLKAAPQDPTRIRDLAIATTPQADLLARAGDLAAACQAAEKSVSLFELLKSRAQLGGRDANKNLPLALAARARYCKR